MDVFNALSIEVKHRITEVRIENSLFCKQSSSLVVVYVCMYYRYIGITFKLILHFFNLLLMKLFMNTLKQFILFTTRILVSCREMILSLHFSHVNKYKTYIYIYSSFAYIHVTTTSFPCILLEFLTWIKIFKSSSKINWWIIPMHKYSILYIKIKITCSSQIVSTYYNV